MTDPAEPESLDVAALLRWPAAMVEEAARFPQTVRSLRLLFAEQVRLLRNLNEASEILLRVARRLEESDLTGALDRVERVADGMQDSLRVLRTPLADPARMERMERAIDDMRDRVLQFMGTGARQAMKAYESLRMPPPDDPPPSGSSTSV